MEERIDNRTGDPIGPRILGIESSCDETAAAVVAQGRTTLSSVVASQFAVHARWGGVVPELASREHLRNIVPVVREALGAAGTRMAELDAIAVTSGPGLAGALLVGVSYAKALAWALGKPLIAVNHLEGHIHAVLLEHADAQQALPAVALVVSGGHTHLYLAEADDRAGWRYGTLGHTVDDAAGEAFDKVAKLLGLGYPGGPWIDRLASFGNPHAVRFRFAEVRPRPGRQRAVSTGTAGQTLPGAIPGEAKDLRLSGSAPDYAALRSDAPPGTGEQPILFSFSGIKTAVARYVDQHGMAAACAARAQVLAALAKAAVEDVRALCDAQTLDLVASFQHAVVANLVERTLTAAARAGARTILVSGGVAANRELRDRFAEASNAHGITTLFPSAALSTDNAAMIAAAAWPKFLRSEFANPALEAYARLPLGG